MDLPASLKHLAPFLQHAKQIGLHEPLMAYYCKFLHILSFKMKESFFLSAAKWDTFLYEHKR